MKLYLAITADKYELPCAVTDKVQWLAEAYDMRTDVLRSYISKGNVRKKDGVKFIKLEV